MKNSSEGSYQKRAVIVGFGTYFKSTLAGKCVIVPTFTSMCMRSHTKFVLWTILYIITNHSVLELQTLWFIFLLLSRLLRSYYIEFSMILGISIKAILFPLWSNVHRYSCCCILWESGSCVAIAGLKFYIIENSFEILLPPTSTFKNWDYELCHKLRLMSHFCHHLFVDGLQACSQHHVAI